MGFLEDLQRGPQQRQEYQDFVNRYEQGPPEEGYSDQEVIDRYRQVTPNISNDEYMQAARQAFERLTPEQRMQFGQQLRQRATTQEVNRSATDEQFQDPDFLAREVTKVNQQQPGFLEQIFGGGSRTSGGSGTRGPGGSNAPEQDLLSNPIAKAALAGIAAVALKHMMGKQR